MAVFGEKLCGACGEIKDLEEFPAGCSTCSVCGPRGMGRVNSFNPPEDAQKSNPRLKQWFQEKMDEEVERVEKERTKGRKARQSGALSRALDHYGFEVAWVPQVREK